MSGKGKKKDKPKPHEIKLFNKNVDLKRYGYDVIRYSALKFHVPESCIAVWDGKPNDYERDDFLFLLCTRVLQHQIALRYRCRILINYYYENDKLSDPRLIKELLYEIIKWVSCGFTISPLIIVEKSLAVTCELFLFLYSKNIDTSPKKLAATWYECYLNLYKKDFEDENGLQEMYESSDRHERKLQASFLNTFIEDHCLPYDTSATNQNLKTLYDDLYLSSLPEEDKVRKREQLATAHENARKVQFVKCIDPAEPKGAAGFNRPKSTGKPLEETNRKLKATSQDRPVTKPEAQPAGATGFNPPKNTGNPLEEASHIGRKLSATSQDRPVTKPEAQPAGATGFNPPKSTVNPWDLVTQVSRSSAAALQKLPVLTPSQLMALYLVDGKVDSPFEQGIRQLKLRCSETAQTSNQKVSMATSAAQSCENQGARSKDLVQSTGSSDLQTGPSEQDIRQPTSDSLGKQSSDQEVTTAIAQHQGAESEGLEYETGSSEMGESSGKSEQKIVE